MFRNQPLMTHAMPTFQKIHRLDLWIILGVVLFLGGCSPSRPPAAPTQNHPQLKVLGMLYGRYLQEHNNRPPATKEKFVAYLEAIPAEWKPLGFDSTEQFLTSPRDGQPLLVVTQKNFGPSSPNGLPYVAYESAGENDKLLGIDARGSLFPLTASELPQ